MLISIGQLHVCLFLNPALCDQMAGHNHGVVSNLSICILLIKRAQLHNCLLKNYPLVILDLKIVLKKN